MLIASYPLLAFTEWMWELDHKTNVGWVLVAFIVVNVLANIGLLICIGCRDFVFKYKVFRVKYIKQQRAKAALQEKLAKDEKKKAEA